MAANTTVYRNSMNTLYLKNAQTSGTPLLCWADQINFEQKGYYVDQESQKRYVLKKKAPI